LRTALGLTICDASFVAVAHVAEELAWTRDPFDRLIVAHAALHDALLVTKDADMHRNYTGCVW
jgi:PIN domain nuclease of toxin-antitoxin system